MTRTWKCLLGAVAVCALLHHAVYADGEPGAVVEIDQAGVARLGGSPTEPADWLYGEREAVWLDDFQPPPGVGVDPVTVPDDGSVGYAVTGSIEDILYRVDRVNRHYRGLDDNGYTTFHAFVPLRTYGGSTGLIAVNPRVFVDDQGRGGLNLGFIHRRYVDYLDRVFGLSGWFDYDEAHQGAYAQLGLSGEIIGRYLSLRGNINLPVGESSQLFNRTFSTSFLQDRLMLLTNGLLETAYQQYDVELAVPVPYFSRFGFEFGLGYYYLNGAVSGVEDGHGISTRFETQVTEDAWVNALVSSDGVFGSNLSVNLELTLPNGQPSRLFRRKTPRAAMTGSVRRTNRVLADITGFSKRTRAINPKTGLPYRVAHIDPNGGGAGTGVADPFGSILQFDGLADGVQSTYDLIVVRGRNDGTDTNLNTTITLFDYQQLLGTGTPHFVGSQGGPVALPMLPFGQPLLTNSGAAPGTSVVRLADCNVVSGLHIDGGGTGIGIDGRMGVNPSEIADEGVRNFEITRNLITNTTTATWIEVEDEPGDDMVGIFDENTVSVASGDGFRLSYEDTGAASGILALSVQNNLFQGTLGDAVNLDLTGAAVADLQINDNEFFLLDFGQFIIGSNFTGSNGLDVFGTAGSFPPDTMGAVGPEYIVEFINQAFAIYDRDGNQLLQIAPDDFWRDIVGLNVLGGPGPFVTFDPRIIYDPTIGRFIATAIDSSIPTNNVYVAISETSDPNGGWNGFMFPADTEGGIRFNDFDMIGVDADGLYISTNNFGGLPDGFDVSIYYIPKADLLLPTPTAANLERFENLSDAIRGSSLQPIVDFGPSDDQAQFLGDFGGGFTIALTELDGTAGGGATLGGTTNIGVPLYVPSGGGRQPAPLFPLEPPTPRFASNVVRVGDSIWAVHEVADLSLLDAASGARWYEIDANTNAVLQTGIISNFGIDYISPSIAVNDQGQVVIGFTGTGPAQNASSMAVVGSTTAGVTTFGTPFILKDGLGDYEQLDGALRNRWGDYSATVVDPNRSNVIWTFQEFVPTANEFAVQISEIILGLGGNNGIVINADDTAVVTGDILRNNLQLGAGTGISVTAGGMSFVDLASTISDNVITNAGTDGMFFGTTGSATLLVSGDRNSVTGSGRNGLFMQSFGTSVLDVDFRNSQFDENAERGVQGEAWGGSSLTFTFTSPPDIFAAAGSSASNNGAQGINLKAFEGATLVATIDNVLVDPNVDAGISIQTEGSSVGIVDITDSTIIDTLDGAHPDYNGDGVVFRAFGDSMLTASIADSLIDGNEGNGVFTTSDGSAILDVTIERTDITNNGFNVTNMLSFSGIHLQRFGLSTQTVTMTDLFVDSNSLFGLNVTALGGDTGGDDLTVTSTSNVFSNNLGGGINYTLGGSGNTFATHTLDLVDMNGNPDPLVLTGDGISVTTNDTSFFGSGSIIAPVASVFDSVVVTNNVGNGYTFTSNDASTLIADIVSDTDPTSTLISMNGIVSMLGDGVEVNHNSSGFTSLRIGNAANPFPDVTITQNFVDAVDLNFAGSGVVDVTIANTLINGARQLGAPADPGVTVEYLGSDTAQVYIGQDMGPGRDPTTGVRSGVIISEIGGTGDGINVLYNRDNDVTGTMNLFVADSIIGTGAGTIGGDGVEMTVQDGGFTGEFYQNTIEGALGDGIRLDTEAEVLVGRVVVVPGDPGPGGAPPDPPMTAQDLDLNADMIGDAVSAMSPFLALDPFYLGQFADGMPGGTDFMTTLIVGDPSLGAGFGGNEILANGESGLEISVGANTFVNATVRDNDLFGNTDGDFTTSTATNTVATLNASVDRAQGMADDVVLDPIAGMNLLFGDSGFFNRGNFTNPSSTGGVWMTGDAFKGAGRPVFAVFNVTLPDEIFPPTPNDFLQNGIQEDEEATFTAAGFIVTPQ